MAIASVERLVGRKREIGIASTALRNIGYPDFTSRFLVFRGIVPGIGRTSLTIMLEGLCAGRGIENERVTLGRDGIDFDHAPLTEAAFRGENTRLPRVSIVDDNLTWQKEHGKKLISLLAEGHERTKRLSIWATQRFLYLGDQFDLRMRERQYELGLFSQEETLAQLEGSVNKTIALKIHSLSSGYPSLNRFLAEEAQEQPGVLELRGSQIAWTKTQELLGMDLLPYERLTELARFDDFYGGELRRVPEGADPLDWRISGLPQLEQFLRWQTPDGYHVIEPIMTIARNYRPQS